MEDVDFSDEPMATPIMPIPLPYSLKHDEMLVTDKHPQLFWSNELDWVVNNVASPEAVERIMRSTTLLMNRIDNPNSLVECLHQAIIWECG